MAKSLKPKTLREKVADVEKLEKSGLPGTSGITEKYKQALAEERPGYVETLSLETLSDVSKYDKSYFGQYNADRIQDTRAQGQGFFAGLGNYLVSGTARLGTSVVTGGATLGQLALNLPSYVTGDFSAPLSNSISEWSESFNKDIDEKFKVYINSSTLKDEGINLTKLITQDSDQVVGEIVSAFIGGGIIAKGVSGTAKILSGAGKSLGKLINFEKNFVKASEFLKANPKLGALYSESTTTAKDLTALENFLSKATKEEAAGLLQNATSAQAVTKELMKKGVSTYNKNMYVSNITGAINSIQEASVESVFVKQSLTEELESIYRQEQGLAESQPIPEDVQKGIDKKVNELATYTFAANIPVLLGTDLLKSARLLVPKNLRNVKAKDKIKGIDYKDGKYVDVTKAENLAKRNKTTEILGKIYNSKFVKDPILEGVQEIYQENIANGSSEEIKALYRKAYDANSTVPPEEILELLPDFMDFVNHTINEAFFTFDHSDAETFILGLMGGALGASLSGADLKNNTDATRTKILEQLNSRTQGDVIKSLLENKKAFAKKEEQFSKNPSLDKTTFNTSFTTAKSLNFSQVLQARAENKAIDESLNKGDEFEYRNKKHLADFKYIQSLIKANRVQDLVNEIAVVSELQGKEQIEYLKEKFGIDVSDVMDAEGNLTSGTESYVKYLQELKQDVLKQESLYNSKALQGLRQINTDLADEYSYYMVGSEKLDSRVNNMVNEIQKELTAQNLTFLDLNKETNNSVNYINLLKIITDNNFSDGLEFYNYIVNKTNNKGKITNSVIDKLKGFADENKIDDESLSKFATTFESLVSNKDSKNVTSAILSEFPQFENVKNDIDKLISDFNKGDFNDNNINAYLRDINKAQSLINDYKDRANLILNDDVYRQLRIRAANKQEEDYRNTMRMLIELINQSKPEGAKLTNVSVNASSDNSFNADGTVNLDSNNETSQTVGVSGEIDIDDFGSVQTPPTSTNTPQNTPQSTPVIDDLLDDGFSDPLNQPVVEPTSLNNVSIAKDNSIVINNVEEFIDKVIVESNSLSKNSKSEKVDKQGIFNFLEKRSGFSKDLFTNFGKKIKLFFKSYSGLKEDFITDTFIKTQLNAKNKELEAAVIAVSNSTTNEELQKNTELVSKIQEEISSLITTDKETQSLDAIKNGNLIDAVFKYLVDYTNANSNGLKELKNLSYDGIGAQIFNLGENGLPVGGEDLFTTDLNKFKNSVNQVLPLAVEHLQKNYLDKGFTLLSNVNVHSLNHDNKLSSRQALIAGEIDILAYNKSTGEVIVIDVKSSLKNNPNPNNYVDQLTLYSELLKRKLKQNEYDAIKNPDLQFKRAVIFVGLETNTQGDSIVRIKDLPVKGKMNPMFSNVLFGKIKQFTKSFFDIQQAYGQNVMNEVRPVIQKTLDKINEDLRTQKQSNQPFTPKFVLKVAELTDEAKKINNTNIEKFSAKDVYYIGLDGEYYYYGYLNSYNDNAVSELLQIVNNTSYSSAFRLEAAALLAYAKMIRLKIEEAQQLVQNNKQPVEIELDVDLQTVDRIVNGYDSTQGAIQESLTDFLNAEGDSDIAKELVSNLYVKGVGKGKEGYYIPVNKNFEEDTSRSKIPVSEFPTPKGLAFPIITKKNGKFISLSVKPRPFNYYLDLYKEAQTSYNQSAPNADKTSYDESNNKIKSLFWTPLNNNNLKNIGVSDVNIQNNYKKGHISIGFKIGTSYQNVIVKLDSLSQDKTSFIIEDKSTTPELQNLFKLFFNTDSNRVVVSQELLDSGSNFPISAKKTAISDLQIFTTKGTQTSSFFNGISLNGFKGNFANNVKGDTPNKEYAYKINNSSSTPVAKPVSTPVAKTEPITEQTLTNNRDTVGEISRHLHEVFKLSDLDAGKIYDLLAHLEKNGETFNKIDFANQIAKYIRNNKPIPLNNNKNSVILNKVLNNLKNDGAFDDILIKTKHSSAQQSFVPVNEKEVLKNIDRLLPKTAVKVVKSFTSKILKNNKVAAFVYDNVIHLSEQFYTKGLEYHEAFHVLLDSVLTKVEYANYIKEAKKLFGPVTKEQLDQFLIENPTYNDAQYDAEEMYYVEKLADAFMDYANKKDADKEKYNVFQKFFNYVKSLLTSVFNNKNSIEKLFTDFYNGNYKNQSISIESQSLKTKTLSGASYKESLVLQKILFSDLYKAISNDLDLFNVSSPQEIIQNKDEIKDKITNLKGVVRNLISDDLLKQMVFKYQLESSITKAELLKLPEELQNAYVELELTDNNGIKRPIIYKKSTYISLLENALQNPNDNEFILNEFKDELSEELALKFEPLFKIDEDLIDKFDELVEELSDEDLAEKDFNLELNEVSSYHNLSKSLKTWLSTLTYSKGVFDGNGNLFSVQSVVNVPKIHSKMLIALSNTTYGFNEKGDYVNSYEAFLQKFNDVFGLSTDPELKALYEGAIVNEEILNNIYNNYSKVEMYSYKSMNTNVKVNKNNEVIYKKANNKSSIFNPKNKGGYYFSNASSSAYAFVNRFKQKLTDLIFSPKDNVKYRDLSKADVEVKKQFGKDVTALYNKLVSLKINSNQEGLKNEIINSFNELFSIEIPPVFIDNLISNKLKYFTLDENTYTKEQFSYVLKIMATDRVSHMNYFEHISQNSPVLKLINDIKLSASDEDFNSFAEPSYQDAENKTRYTYISKFTEWEGFNFIKSIVNIKDLEKREAVLKEHAEHIYNIPTLRKLFLSTDENFNNIIASINVVLYGGGQYSESDSSLNYKHLNPFDKIRHGLNNLFNGFVEPYVHEAKTTNTLYSVNKLMQHVFGDFSNFFERVESKNNVIAKATTLLKEMYDSENQILVREKERQDEVKKEHQKLIDSFKKSKAKNNSELISKLKDETYLDNLLHGFHYDYVKNKNGDFVYETISNENNSVSVRKVEFLNIASTIPNVLVKEDGTLDETLLDQSLKEYVETLLANNINGNEFLHNSNISSYESLKLDYPEVYEAVKATYLMQYATNKLVSNLINHSNVSELVFKSYIDQSKRMTSFVNSGFTFENVKSLETGQIEETYNVAILPDDTMSFYGNESEKIEGTDGQSFVTPIRRLKQLIALGRVKLKDKYAFEFLSKQYQTGEYLKTHNSFLEYINDKIKSVKGNDSLTNLYTNVKDLSNEHLFSVMKTVVSSTGVSGAFGEKTSPYMKHSEAVMVREHFAYWDKDSMSFKAKPGMEKGFAIYEQMLSENIDTLAHISGVKIGRSKISIADKDNYVKLKPIAVQNKNARLQQETPSGKELINEGSQKRQVLSANTPAYSEKTVVKNRLNNKLVNYGEIQQVIGQLSGIIKKNNRKKVPIFNNFKEFAKQIKNQISSSNKDVISEEKLRVVGNKFKYSLDHPNGIQKIEQNIVSVLNKGLLRLKTNGSKLVLVSGSYYKACFNKKTGNPVYNVTPDMYNNPDYEFRSLDSHNLILNKSGSYDLKFAEAIVSKSFFEKMGLSYGEFLELSQKDKDKLCETFGYRIPTTSQKAGTPIKIVGVIDNVFGDVCILSPEAVAISGADYDVDSIYVNYKKPKKYRDSDGNLKLLFSTYLNNNVNETTVRQLLEYKRGNVEEENVSTISLLKDAIAKNQITLNNVNKNVLTEKDTLYNELTAPQETTSGVVSIRINDVVKQYLFVPIEKNPQYYIQNSITELIANEELIPFNDLDDSHINSVLAAVSDYNYTTNEVSDFIIDAYISLYSFQNSREYFDQYISKADPEIMVGVAEKFGEAKGIGKSKFKKLYHLPQNATNSNIANSMGKTTIGVVASIKSGASVLEKHINYVSMFTKVKYPTITSLRLNKSNKINVDFNSFINEKAVDVELNVLPNGKLELVQENGEVKTKEIVVLDMLDSLSQLTTDDAKYLASSKINLTPHTAHLFAILPRYGFGPTLISLIANSNYVQSYNNLKSINSNTNVKGFREALNNLIPIEQFKVFSTSFTPEALIELYNYTEKYKNTQALQKALFESFTLKSFIISDKLPFEKHISLLLNNNIDVVELMSPNTPNLQSFIERTGFVETNQIKISTLEKVRMLGLNFAVAELVERLDFLLKDIYAVKRVYTNTNISIGKSYTDVTNTIETVKDLKSTSFSFTDLDGKSILQNIVSEILHNDVEQSLTSILEFKKETNKLHYYTSSEFETIASGLKDIFYGINKNNFDSLIKLPLLNAITLNITENLVNTNSYYKPLLDSLNVSNYEELYYELTYGKNNITAQYKKLLSGDVEFKTETNNVLKKEIVKEFISTNPLLKQLNFEDVSAKITKYKNTANPDSFYGAKVSLNTRISRIEEAKNELIDGSVMLNNPVQYFSNVEQLTFEDIEEVSDVIKSFNDALLIHHIQQNGFLFKNDSFLSYVHPNSQALIYAELTKLKEVKDLHQHILNVNNVSTSNENKVSIVKAASGITGLSLVNQNPELLNVAKSVDADNYSILEIEKIKNTNDFKVSFESVNNKKLTYTLSKTQNNDKLKSINVNNVIKALTKTAKNNYENYKEGLQALVYDTTYVGGSNQDFKAFIAELKNKIEITELVNTTNDINDTIENNEQSNLSESKDLNTQTVTIEQSFANDLMNKLAKAFGIPISFENLDNNSFGYYDKANNRIVVNSSKELKLDTMFHEVAHPFIDIIAEQDPELFESLYNEALKNNPDLANTIAKEYGFDKNSIEFKKELLATVLGYESGNQYLNNKKKSLLQKFYGFIHKMFKNVFNLEVDATMSIADVANKLASMDSNFIAKYYQNDTSLNFKSKIQNTLKDLLNSELISYTC